MEPINVLVVDDSSLMRKFITKLLEEDSSIRVVDTAINGIFALKKIEYLDVDVVLLDIEMPEMNGIEFLKKCRELNIDIPTIILSALGKNRPKLTLECIKLGAKDFIVKPSGNISLDIHSIKDEIISKIKFFHSIGFKHLDKRDILKEKIDKISKKSSPDRFTRDSPQPKEVSFLNRIPNELKNKLKAINSLEAVVIGISTGGPYALRKIIPRFPANFPLSILIVQHMPEGFTYEFTKGLDEICSLSVKEAEDGDILKKGTVYIAPGNRHLLVKLLDGSPKIRLSGSGLVCGHRPSVELLFNSALEAFNNRIIGVIMTGMGKDGAKAIRKIKLNGGIALAQDEKTSVIFGMPKVAIDLDGVDEVLDLDSIPKRIIEIASYFFYNFRGSS